MSRTLVFAVTAPLGALLLSGCLGGLLGGGKPAQMYRFGASAAPTPPGPAPAAMRAIQLAPVAFAAEIDIDRLLATRATSTMYIKGARWVSPAPDLFTAALHDAFRRRAPAIALVDRRDGGAAAPVLQVAITRFEARFGDGGDAAAPEVRIEGQAVLTDAKGRTPGARYRISAVQPAASARIDDIVAAFGAADERAVDAVTDWAATQPR